MSGANAKAMETAPTELMALDQLRLVAERYRSADQVTVVTSIIIGIVLGYWSPLWQIVTWTTLCVALAIICIAINSHYLSKTDVTLDDSRRWRIWVFVLLRIPFALTWSLLVHFGWSAEVPQSFTLAFMFVTGSMVLNALTAAGMPELLLIEIVTKTLSVLAAVGVFWLSANDPFGSIYFAHLLMAVLVAGLSLSIGFDLHRTMVHQVRQKYELQHAKQSAEAANRAKSSFLSVMSHEVRAPLNGMLTVVNLLRKSRSKALREQYVDAINQSGQTLLTIVNDVLDLSVLETGKIKIKSEPVNLEDMIHTVVLIMKSQATSKGLELSSHMFGDIPQHVITDGGRIRQVLINLIDNAVRHTKKGSVCLEVSYETPNAANKTHILKFLIIDTGIGIAKENQSLLFEEFVQFSNRDSLRNGGTGLGLAICKQIVDLMDGEIGATSEPGQGATFWFWIPVLPCSEADYKAHEDLYHAATRLKPLKILVAEDNEINQIVIRSLLESYDHHVTMTDDGAQCVAKAKKEEFDVILMDMRMPKTGGIEATRQIRALPSAASTTPIIALSAQLSPREEQSWQGVGIDAYIPKPIEIPLLFRELARLLPEKNIHPNTRSFARQKTPVARPPKSILPKAAFDGELEQSGFDTNALDELVAIKGNDYAKDIVKKSLLSIHNHIDNLKKKPPMPARQASSEIHQIIGLARLIGLRQTAETANKFHAYYLERSKSPKKAANKKTNQHELLSQLERAFKNNRKEVEALYLKSKKR